MKWTYAWEIVDCHGDDAITAPTWRIAVLAWIDHWHITKESFQNWNIFCEPGQEFTDNWEEKIMDNGALYFNIVWQGQFTVRHVYSYFEEG